MTEQYLPTSPVEVSCRSCKAAVGERCTTKLKAGGKWLRVLKYFHSTRWRDFERARNERAAMNDWNKKYGNSEVA